MAVADTLLRRAPWRDEPREEPSLADRFIATTHTEHMRFDGRARKRIEEVMMRYRIDMKHANRFMLDDDFTRYATHMANAQPEKVLSRLQYATLPYEQTWIEFDLHVKVDTIRQLHKVEQKGYEGIARRMGFLLQRISDTEAVCTLVSDVSDVDPNDGAVIPHIVCYFFSLNEHNFLLDNRSFFGCNPVQINEEPGLMQPEYHITASFRHDPDLETDHLGKASLWGYTGAQAPLPPRSPYLNHGDISSLRTPSFLMRHGDIGFSRMFDPYRMIFEERGQQKKLNLLILAEMREFIGQVRWLVTVLAMLNQVPVYAEHVVRSHQMKVGQFKKHVTSDYHKVTLRLPKTKPLPYLERHIRGPSERRHRAHEVRAHWRTYLHAEHCGMEDHDWTYDYDDGYRLCGKCMAYGRLIHEHVRGNAELGWVRKDYVIKPSVKP